MQTLLNYGFEQIEWQVALLSFLLAFILTTIIALIYEKTFQGLSYSRGLVQSMILGSIVSCLLMIAIGDNIARPHHHQSFLHSRYSLNGFIFASFT